jgi:hypothetical protein
MKKVARMLRAHEELLLNWFRAKGEVSAGAVEGLNNKIPYIGGEEITDSPTQQGHRFIIDFGEMPEAEAQKWPDLYDLVRRKVKPYRDGLKRDVYRTKWWQFGEKQTALYATIKDLKRVLVTSRVSQHGAFTFLRNGMVFADSLVVFCMESDAAFCTLQSSRLLKNP